MPAAVMRACKRLTSTSLRRNLVTYVGIRAGESRHRRLGRTQKPTAGFQGASSSRRRDSCAIFGPRGGDGPPNVLVAIFAERESHCRLFPAGAGDGLPPTMPSTTSVTAIAKRPGLPNRGPTRGGRRGNRAEKSGEEPKKKGRLRLDNYCVKTSNKKAREGQDRIR